MPAVSQSTKYKGFTIAKTWQGWKAVDADGDFVFSSRTKTQVKGGISAIVNGATWMINDLRKHGYNKI
jgi:hypothetical protein